MRNPIEELQERTIRAEIKSTKRLFWIIGLAIFTTASWVITFLSAYDIYSYKQELSKQYQLAYEDELNKSIGCEAQLKGFKGLLGK